MGGGAYLFHFFAFSGCPSHHAKPASIAETAAPIFLPNGRFWPEAEVQLFSRYVGNRGQSGRVTDIVKRLLLTQSGSPSADHKLRASVIYRPSGNIASFDQNLEPRRA
jgi:hypothetical protein